MAEKKGTELTIFQKIDSPGFKTQLARALPNETLKADRLVRLALTLLKKSDALAKCDELSVMACVVESAQLGLELENVQGHAYIVPFKGTATLIVGYRGFAHLMYQTGIVSDVSMEIVRSYDKFHRTLGSNRQLLHEPAPIRTKQVDGVYVPDDGEKDWLGAYANVEFMTGRNAWHYMEAAEIMAARNRSAGYRSAKKYGKDSPWIGENAIEMWKKTPLRRLAKRMPTSTTDKRPELLRAALIDEYGEKPGLLIPTLGGFQVNPNPPVDKGDPLDASKEVSNVDFMDDSESDAIHVSGMNETDDVIDVQAQSEDDKGDAWEPPPAEEKKAPAPAKAAAPKKAGKLQPPPGGNPAVPKANIPPERTTKKEPFVPAAKASNLYNIANVAGWKINELKDYLLKKHGIKNINEIPVSKWAEIENAIRNGS